MSTHSLTDHSKLDSFSERVTETHVGPCHLLMMRTPVRSVVTWRGSFKTYPALEADEDLLQNLVVSLLDKGTRRRDRFAVAEVLENRGAEVDFSSDGLYVDLSGRSLAEDVSDVFELVAEQLREPLFDAGEFEKAAARIAAAIQRSMENTGSQASGSLKRHVYPVDHPNHTPDPRVRLERLATLTLDDVIAYHRDHIGAREFTLVVVGDVDEHAIEKDVERLFGDWTSHDAPARYADAAVETTRGRSVVLIPEKQNVDVRMGHSVSFRRDDVDYLPAFLANFALGGNFSSRLMQTIRDEMGLTYGIRSALSGITTDYAGHWQVAVTLSEENVERGTAATLGEVRKFVDGGMMPDELEEKKTTVVGSFTVGLATTAGLASTLLQNAERGFDVGYLDRFPDEVNGVTIDQANAVIAKHFSPDRFHTALAGTVPEEVPAD